MPPAPGQAQHRNVRSTHRGWLRRRGAIAGLCTRWRQRLQQSGEVGRRPLELHQRRAALGRLLLQLGLRQQPGVAAALAAPRLLLANRVAVERRGLQLRGHLGFCCGARSARRAGRAGQAGGPPALTVWPYLQAWGPWTPSTHTHFLQQAVAARLEVRRRQQRPPPLHRVGEASTGGLLSLTDTKRSNCPSSGPLHLPLPRPCRQHSRGGGLLPRHLSPPLYLMRPTFALHRLWEP